THTHTHTFHTAPHYITSPPHTSPHQTNEQPHKLCMYSMSCFSKSSDAMKLKNKVLNLSFLHNTHTHTHTPSLSHSLTLSLSLSLLSLPLLRAPPCSAFSAFSSLSLLFLSSFFLVSLFFFLRSVCSLFLYVLSSCTLGLSSLLTNSRRVAPLSFPLWKCVCVC